MFEDLNWFVILSKWQEWQHSIMHLRQPPVCSSGPPKRHATDVGKLPAFSHSIILTHSDTCDTDAQGYTQDKPLLLQGAKVQNISKTIGSAPSLFGAAEHHRNGTARRGIWHLEVGNLNTYDQTRI